MTKTEMQDIVLRHLQDALQDTVTVRERISDTFMIWFQSHVEVPQMEVVSEGQQPPQGAEGEEEPPPEEG